MSIPTGEQILGPAGALGSVTVTGTAQVSSSGAPLQLFRDSTITQQITNSSAAPAAGATIATITPSVAGLWEISGFVLVTGTTVAAVDTNNMELFLASTGKINPILFVVPATVGMVAPQPLPVIVMQLSGANTVNIKAIANATAASLYLAQIVCRQVG
jgi:hypothetical protein